MEVEVSELFSLLESNKPHIVEEIKGMIHENFNKTRESWLVHGLFDYYLATNSTRVVEVLAAVREPHDKYLFDRIKDALGSPVKLQALTLLGEVVRKHPTWIYKITQHALMKELVRMLKVETDIIALMSGILIIVTLLPMIPASVGPFLPDIFEVFSRLAAWNTLNPNKVPDVHLLHLQVALYALFHRLYGMYPCNFLSFLRLHYGQRENLAVFTHTIKPMLDKVKMHPFLVTASKETETATTRWRKMEHHDVVVECSRFALDSMENSFEAAQPGIPQPPIPRPRAPTDAEPHGEIFDAHHFLSFVPTSGPIQQAIQSGGGDPGEVWSPSLSSSILAPPANLDQESVGSLVTSPVAASQRQTPASTPSQVLQVGSVSPPEAAVEATPETTPVQEESRRPSANRLPLTSTVPRALDTFTNLTPNASQPSSPLKKDSSSFRFSSENVEVPHSQLERRDSLFSQRLQHYFNERTQALSLNADAQTKPSNQAAEKDNKNSAAPTKQDDQASSLLSSVPSVITDHHAPSRQESLELNGNGQHSIACSETEIHELQDDFDECSNSGASPCATGGLHMPDSQSMRDFAKRVSRLRFFSQCGGPPNIPDILSVGSSSSDTGMLAIQQHSYVSRSGQKLLKRGSIRRSNSCPNMMKDVEEDDDDEDTAFSKSVVTSTNDAPAVGFIIPPEASTLKSVPEKVEPSLVVSEAAVQTEGNVRLPTVLHATGQVGTAKTNTRHTLPDAVTSTTSPNSNCYLHPTDSSARHSFGTQTNDVLTPFPYEHLFLGILTPTSTPEPHAIDTSHLIKEQPKSPEEPSPYQLLDRYISASVALHRKQDRTKSKTQSVAALEAEVRIFKEQSILLHMQLQFERQRREVHAERNRRLLGKAKANKALEEHNAALQDQLRLLQADLETLNREHEQIKKESRQKEKELQDCIAFWEEKVSSFQKQNRELRDENQDLERQVKKQQEDSVAMTKDLQAAQSALFNARATIQQLSEEADAGRLVRSSLDQINQEFCLLGELHQRFRERIAEPRVLIQEQSELFQGAAQAEVGGVRQLLESRTSSLEAYKARVSELESQLTKREMLIAEQKRLLKVVKEEGHEQLLAVEEKYQALRIINQHLEAEVLELHHRLSETKATHEPCRSPGAGSSSSHSLDLSESEKAVGHSPPLSQSYEGKGAVGSVFGDVPIQNLETIVDQEWETERPGGGGATSAFTNEKE